MYDPFRDSWIRYLGYANEIGESFRHVVPASLVRFSYTIAFGYVFADPVDKGIRKFTSDGRMYRVGVAAADALIWQSLASVIIPGFIINRICAHTALFLYRRNVKLAMSNILVATAGLVSIPIIIRPIDKSVDLLMDNTYRKVFENKE